MMGNEEELTKISREIASCQNCPLYKSAINPVPGSGNSQAKIVFIGEAPGYWEDQRGVPFCGSAGNLLDRLLAKINLKRDEIFITNILKHRPPNNRDPLPTEIKACTPFLKRQLQVIKPKIIIGLGKFALNFFLPHLSISQIHGQAKKIAWENLNLILLPLYHPAAALRNNQLSKELEKDFLEIPKLIQKINQPNKTLIGKQSRLF